MTTHRQQQYKARRATPESRAAALYTSEEYLEAARWSRVWKWLITSLLVGLLVLAGIVAYVTTVQLVSQTDLVRPLTPQQRAWVQLGSGPRRQITLASTAPMRPRDWEFRLAPALYECSTRPGCMDYLRGFTLYVLGTSPEVRAARGYMEWLAGGLALALPFGLVAGVEAAWWPNWEKAFMSRQTRRRKRGARGGRED